ncbi:MAG: hypothetical protein PHC89_02285 [Candidatus Pacebacteria bacterium]|nr:hypothetical protein [Candidatus Paceibacterota bacterium]
MKKYTYILLASALLFGGAGTLFAQEIEWKIHPTPSNYLVSSVIHEDNLFVAVGGVKGEDLTDFTPLILTSEDGIKWTEQDLDGLGVINSVAYGNDTFVAGGSIHSLLGPLGAVSPRVFISPDGKQWNEVEDLGLDEESVLSIAYGKDLFVLTTNSPVIAPKIYTSSDGITWTEQTPSSAPASAAFVFYGNELFVIISNDLVLTSSDGIEWDDRTSSFPEGEVTSFNSTNNLFILSVMDEDETAHLFISSDGITWNEHSSPFGDGELGLHKNVTYTNNLYVTGGSIFDVEEATSTNYLFSSNNLESWEREEFPFLDFIPIFMFYEDDQYVVIGGPLYNDGSSSVFLTGTLQKDNGNLFPRSSSIFGTRFCSETVTTFCRPQNGFTNNNPLISIYTELLGLYQQLLSAMQSENSL